MRKYRKNCKFRKKDDDRNSVSWSALSLCDVLITLTEWPEANILLVAEITHCGPISVSSFPVTILELLVTSLVTQSSTPSYAGLPTHSSVSEVWAPRQDSRVLSTLPLYAYVAVTHMAPAVGRPLGNKALLTDSSWGGGSFLKSPHAIDGRHRTPMAKLTCIFLAGTLLNIWMDHYPYSWRSQAAQLIFRHLFFSPSALVLKLQALFEVIQKQTLKEN